MKSIRQHTARFLSAFGVTSVALVAAIALAAVPSGTPPDNNTATPINVTSSDQAKEGNLGLDSLTANDQLCLGPSCISSWEDVAASTCGLGVPEPRSYNTDYVAETAGFAVFDASCSSHLEGNVSNTGGPDIAMTERKGSGSSGGSMTLVVPAGATWQAQFLNGCGWGANHGLFWVPLMCSN